MPISVAVVGASGYTGAELLRVLSLYEEVEVNQITSRQFAGKTLREVFPVFTRTKYQNLTFTQELDLSSDYYFLALPHEASLETAKFLLDNGKKVIDLSGAYRIQDVTKYPEFYGFDHSYPYLLERAVYGLPEIFREKIKSAQLVANPGCYPTSVLLAVYPAVKENILVDDIIIVNALSGISGAGRTPKQHFHYPESYSDSYPYNVAKHRHTPEMEDVIKRVAGKDVSIRFTPHILPISRGMLSTVVFRVDIDKNDLTELYHQIYKNEPFIRLLDTPPHIKNVVGSNYCDLYVEKDEKTGMAVICSCIDNLGKGASTQALQNFNLMAGIDESRYLSIVSQLSTLFP